MKQRARRAVVRIGQTERQQRRDRLLAVERADRAEAARLGKGQARRTIGSERWRRIHVLAPAGRRSRRTKLRCKEVNAAELSRRQGDLLDAGDRPYRSGATATAGDGAG